MQPLSIKGITEEGLFFSFCYGLCRPTCSSAMLFYASPTKISVSSPPFSPVVHLRYQYPLLLSPLFVTVHFSVVELQYISPVPPNFHIDLHLSPVFLSSPTRSTAYSTDIQVLILTKALTQHAKASAYALCIFGKCYITLNHPQYAVMATSVQDCLLGVILFTADKHLIKCLLYTDRWNQLKTLLYTVTYC